MSPASPRVAQYTVTSAPSAAASAITDPSPNVSSSGCATVTRTRVTAPSWTTYELVRQSERSLRFFFPRAERAVYLEAKRLVAFGWAEAEKVATGRRSGTSYRITEQGMAAWRQWTRRPSAPTQLESEAMLKLFVGDRSQLDRLRDVVAEMAAQASAAQRVLAAQAGEGLAGAAAFPERMDANMLPLVFLADLQRAILDWAGWADGAIEVLATDDPEAIRAQTTAALERIAQASPLPDR